MLKRMGKKIFTIFNILKVLVYLNLCFYMQVPVIKIKLKEIRHVIKRRFLLKQIVSIIGARYANILV